MLDCIIYLHSCAIASPGHPLLGIPSHEKRMLEDRASNCPLSGHADICSSISKSTLHVQWNSFFRTLLFYFKNNYCYGNEIAWKRHCELVQIRGHSLPEKPGAVIRGPITKINNHYYWTLPYFQTYRSVQIVVATCYGALFQGGRIGMLEILNHHNLLGRIDP